MDRIERPFARNGNRNLDEEDNSTNEALLAVASAEEYASKISRLQEACLRPLKEDLADWLNKILNTSTITTDNFMDKLDNGVIICRLAKIISIWCLKQYEGHTYDNIRKATSSGKILAQKYSTFHQTGAKLSQSQFGLDSQSPPEDLLDNSSYNSRLSSSSSNINSPIKSPIQAIYDTTQHHVQNNGTPACAQATPIRRFQARVGVMSNPVGVFKASSRSANCISNSALSRSSSTKFLNNLVEMDRSKIWEDAKCRTFYARDNVCSFIRWSKEFGVNQSVLFESDDLVSHANTRQVVLCLLDVARIAYVKHGFTEAPGLVKFEQEIDRELAAGIEDEYSRFQDGYELNGSSKRSTAQSSVTASKNGLSSHGELLNLSRSLRGASITDATDELILRYCQHKEARAARDREAEQSVKEAPQAAERNSSQTDTTNSRLDPITCDDHLTEMDEVSSTQKPDEAESQFNKEPQNMQCDSPPSAKGYDRVDSLDSGEGRTESASTSHSQTHISSSKKQTSSIPTLIKRSSSSVSLTSNHTTSMSTSELSSSRSSLMSAQDGNDSYRQNSSDLDGKVMRIAKSYYGKGVMKGVTRLSEGKYKIADRIVFVRLLKGSRVMVRIGGGWDTLENFLFRHKSDPSQVIDVDNLLPIETKVTFDKASHNTPGANKFSKLPYYRRSDSASSTNLSLSHVSHSPTCSIASTTHMSVDSLKPASGGANIESRPSSKQSPYFLINRGQNMKPLPQSAIYNPKNSTRISNISGPSQQPRTLARYANRSHVSGSVTNLYPATLTTKPIPTNVKSGATSKLNSPANLHNLRTNRQDAFKRLGRSSDSLQANMSPHFRVQNSSTHNVNINSCTRRKLVSSHSKPLNSLAH